MTGGEHQPQKVVSDVVVEVCFDIRHSELLLDFDFVSELFVFAHEPLAAAQVVNRTMLGVGHEPRTRIVRDA
jgi:hypothetical protein